MDGIRTVNDEEQDNNMT